LRKRFQISGRQFESSGDASVNVVSLLEIDVLEQIASDTSSWNRIAVHVDPSQSGNRAFHWHESLAEVFVNAGIYP
jgi:hypothetical protein